MSLTAAEAHILRARTGGDRHPQRHETMQGVLRSEERVVLRAQQHKSDVKIGDTAFSNREGLDRRALAEKNALSEQGDRSTNDEAAPRARHVYNGGSQRLRENHGKDDERAYNGFTPNEALRDEPVTHSSQSDILQSMREKEEYNSKVGDSRSSGPVVAQPRSTTEQPRAVAAKDTATLRSLPSRMYIKTFSSGDNRGFIARREKLSFTFLQNLVRLSYGLSSPPKLCASVRLGDDTEIVEFTEAVADRIRAEHASKVLRLFVLPEST